MIKQISRYRKYKNQKTEIDGIKFDSLKESRRYIELRTLQRTGVISDLALQVKYELQPSFKINNKTIRAITYIADFTYYENGKLVVEDVKASKKYTTEVYKLKKKMFMYKYKGEIKETY